MDKNILQNIRYKLQKRISKLNSIHQPKIYHSGIKQFLNYIESSVLLSGILYHLSKLKPEAEKLAQELVALSKQKLFTDEIEHIVASCYLLKKCIDNSNPKIEVIIGSRYVGNEVSEGKEFFHEYFVETLYEYIDEQLDDRNAIIGILLKYKQKCEWFQRSYLSKLSLSESEKGEHHLAYHLYEYLHDQGIEFYIEPSSASGRPDLVTSQKGDNPLVADAKIFNPNKSKGTGYILTGINQLFQYSIDYNQQFAYLIIFKQCKEHLRFSFANSDMILPFFSIHNKTIFLCIIDIFEYEESASKRGKLKTYTISEDDIITEINVQEKTD